MLQQECAWFDDENHSTGALSSRLTGDAGYIHGAIVGPLNQIAKSISAISIGIFVAFGYSVKLSVGCMAAFPLSLLIVILESRLVQQCNDLRFYFCLGSIIIVVKILCDSFKVYVKTDSRRKAITWNQYENCD